MKNAVPALLFGQNDGTLGPDGTWLPGSVTLTWVGGE
jgi:hypothetical protein